jgi:hypothetical protein
MKLHFERISFKLQVLDAKIASSTSVVHCLNNLFGLGNERLSVRTASVRL